jgi:hypothetical protein
VICCCSCLIIDEVICGILSGIREAVKEMVVQTLMGTAEHLSSGIYWT